MPTLYPRLAAALVAASLSTLLPGLCRLALAGLFDHHGRALAPGSASGPAVAWERVRARERPRYAAVGTLEWAQDTEQRSCSATVLDAGGPAEAPAYVVTAGHCIEEADRFGLVLADRPPPAGLGLRLQVGARSRDGLWRAVRRITWASRQGRDLAVLELAATTGEVAAAGVRAVALAPVPAAPGRRVDLVAVPWPDRARAWPTLRRARCDVQAVANLALDDVYYAEGLVAHRCSSAKGSSGGALLDAASGRLLAVHVSASTWTGFAQPVDALHGCFDAAGRFDLARPECRLEAPCPLDAPFACHAEQCARGVGGACYQVAVLYTLGRGGAPRDVPQALRWMREACASGHARGCHALAERLRAHPADAAPGESELRYLERACDGHEIDDCYELARRHMYGLGMPVSDDTALAYLQRACAMGHQAACTARVEVYGKPTVAPAAARHPRGSNN